jgi:hypothetical protein
LPGELVWLPCIVVIAKSDHGADGSGDTGVPGSGQTSSAGIAQHAQLPPSKYFGGQRLRLALVEDHQALQLTGVRLAKDAGHSA